MSANDRISVSVEVDPGFAADDAFAADIRARYVALVGIGDDGTDTAFGAHGAFGEAFDVYRPFADQSRVVVSMWADEVRAGLSDFDAFGSEVSGRGEVIDVVVTLTDEDDEQYDRTYRHGRIEQTRTAALVPDGARDLTAEYAERTADVAQLRDLLTVDTVGQYDDLRRVLDLFERLGAYVGQVG